MPRPLTTPLSHRRCDQLEEVYSPERAAPDEVFSECFRSAWAETLEDLGRALDGHRQKQEHLIAALLAAPPRDAAAPRDPMSPRAGALAARDMVAERPPEIVKVADARAPRDSVSPCAGAIAARDLLAEQPPAIVKVADAPAPLEAKVPLVVVEADKPDGDSDGDNKVDAMAKSSSMLSSTSAQALQRRVEALSKHRQHVKNRVEEVEAALQAFQQLGPHTTKLQRAHMVYLHGLRWWLAVEEPPRTGRLAHIMTSVTWELPVSLLIFCNSVFMAAMVEHSIVVQTSLDTEATDEDMMFAVEAGFLAMFAFELALRLFVHRLYFFIADGAAWNNFDLFIILLSISDLLSQRYPFPTSGNATFVRCIRVVRLVRSLRIVRILKHANALRRMLLSLMGSLIPLLWCLVLLLSVFYLFSLATVQGVANYLLTSTGDDPAWRADLLDRFGTVSNTMMTYYKATCGGTGWGVHFEVLRKTGLMNAMVYLGAVAFTQIAVLNIMTGVFVENSFKNAQPDRNAMALAQRRTFIMEANELHQILKTVDTDGTGNISEAEFIKLSMDPRLNGILEVMGLDIKDAHLLHSMLRKEDGSKEVNMDFLVHSLIKMKGPAMSVDLQALAYKTDLLSERVAALTTSRSKNMGGQASTRSKRG